jgi:hypothetical protein
MPMAVGRLKLYKHFINNPEQNNNLLWNTSWLLNLDLTRNEQYVKQGLRKH